MKKRSIIISAAVLALSTAAASATVPVMLTDDQYVEAKNISAQEVYQVNTTVGDDVEFKLEENADRQELWQVVSYDPVQCRIKIDHEKKGVWPFKCEYAEIELKGLKRGEQDVVLQCGAKRITIRFKAL